LDHLSVYHPKQGRYAGQLNNLLMLERFSHTAIQSVEEAKGNQYLSNIILLSNEKHIPNSQDSIKEI